MISYWYGTMAEVLMVCGRMHPRRTVSMKRRRNRWTDNDMSLATPRAWPHGGWRHLHHALGESGVVQPSHKRSITAGA